MPFLRDPIRLDRIGEHRWWAKIADEKNHNPIRLVRMVEKIESTIRSLQFLWGMKFMDCGSHLIHHPCKTDGVLRTADEFKGAGHGFQGEDAKKSTEDMVAWFVTHLAADAAK